MKYALTNGKILNGHKDMEVQEGLTVYVEGEKITDIRGGEVPSKGYRVIDLEGKYLMPGMINMHVHLPASGKPQKKQRDNTKLVQLVFSNPISAKIAFEMVAGNAKTEMLSGVTTIRTVGGVKNYDTKLRDAINAGKREGPRILASDEGISVPGGHMAGSVAYPAKNIEEALECVHRAHANHADLIKLMITGGVLDAKEKGTPGEMKMDPAMIKAVCEEAHKLGYIVAAHVESPEGVRAALENGVDSIEHGAKPDDEIIRLFKENHAFLTTTLSPALPFALFDQSVSCADDVGKYNGEIVFNGIVDCAKRALEEGIPVALGNDVGCPWITHYDFWRELVYYHKFIGVSNQFALYSGTLGNAELAGIADITGSIDIGKDADLIVTKENPLDNLEALRNVTTVMARGRLYTDYRIKKMIQTERELDRFV